MNKTHVLRVLAFGLSFLLQSASAFEAAPILSDLRAAQAVPLPRAAAAPPAAPGEPTPELENQIQRARLETDARFKLESTCDARFGGLQRTLERQVSRSEKIAVVGGLVGAIGAVATCPHCAALGAALAGLANPLQQTFKANADTPQDTQDKLNKLSAKINQEFDTYRSLPAAVPGQAKFDENLAARIDILFTITASCKYYSTSLEVSGSDTPKAP